MGSGRYLLLVLVVVFLSVGGADSSECVYTLYVQTGSIIKAGTDSIISVTFAGSHGKSVYVPDLKKWGVMGPRHDYYERDNLDIFTGRGSCIDGPICYLKLTSDGLGNHHGWFCDSVQITSTGPHKACRQSIFYVDQWLAIDAAPYELTSVIDRCNMDLNGLSISGPEGVTSYGPFSIRKKPIGSASH